MATDNPTWGYRHAVQVHGSLEKVATSVELFLPDDGKDVTDHLNNGQDISELIAMRVADLRALCAATTAKTRQRTRSADHGVREVPAVLRDVLGALVVNGGTVTQPTSAGGDWTVSC